MLDVDINSYIEVSIYRFNMKQLLKLDLRCKLYFEKFIVKVEELLEIINLEIILIKLEGIKETENYMIEFFNIKLTYIYNKVLKYIVSLSKNILNSKLKIKLLSKKLYQCDIIQLYNFLEVNVGRIVQWDKDANIDYIEVSAIYLAKNNTARQKGTMLKKLIRNLNTIEY